MASASITFTFPENAFGQREHGQPLRKLKSIRRETGAKFIIDLKKVDADGNLTCGRASTTSVSRRASLWSPPSASITRGSATSQNTSTDDATQTEKVRPATTLQRVANVAPERLQNGRNKVRKSPPALTGINTKRDRSPTPDTDVMTGRLCPLPPRSP